MVIPSATEWKVHLICYFTLILTDSGIKPDTLWRPGFLAKGSSPACHIHFIFGNIFSENPADRWRAGRQPVSHGTITPCKPHLLAPNLALLGWRLGMLARAASLGPCQVQSARIVLLVHVKSFAFMPCLPARLWGCATLMSYLPVNEFWLSSGAEDVGGQHWDGRGRARCLVPWLGWDPVLPGCPWPCLFSCFCVLKGSCRAVSCIGDN